MFKKFKTWLFNKYLPAYCKEKLIEENKALIEKNLKLEQTIREQQAYIDGLEKGIRSSRPIIKNITQGG